jgi:O-antigen/teichoic acid export membrane protein
MKELAIKHKDFPIYRAPQAFLDTLALQLPVIILASFFGPASAGFYTLGNKVLKNPINIVSKAIGNVLYPNISKNINQGLSIKSKLIKINIFFILTGIIPLLLFYFYAPIIFEFVFGEDWLVAGEYAKWLSIWAFFNLLKAIIIQAIPVLKLQRFFLLFELFSSIIRVTVMIMVAIIFKNDIYTIIAFCLSSSFFIICLILYTLNKSS